MELLGLAFLFVIVIFGLLIYLSMTSHKNTSFSKDKYLQPKIASSILDAMLKTQIKCGTTTYSLTDLLKDCMDPTRQRISCPQYNYIPGYSQHLVDENINIPSCNISENMLERMLSQTFGKYKVGYYLVIKSLGNDGSQDSGENLFQNKFNTTYCGEQFRHASPAVQPFELSSGSMEIDLGMC